MTDSTATARELHRHTAELLPWLLNGSLEAEERRLVESHLAECAECRADLAATRQSYELYTSHLPADLILAYAEDGGAVAYPVETAEGEPRRVERARVEEHLEGCAACRDEVDMTRASFAELAREAESAPAGTLAFRRPEPEAQTPAPARVYGSPRWLPVALAASLLFALLTAGGWFLESQRLDDGQSRIAELQRELDAARAAVEDARTRVASGAATGAGPDTEVGTGDGDALAALADYERQLSELQGEMEALTAQLSSEEGRVAALEDELALRAGPATRPDPAYASFFLGETRGNEGGAGQVPLGRGENRPVVVSLADDGSGVVREGEPVTYRVLDGSGEVVAEGQVTPRRDSQGFLDSSLILYPAQLPAGALTLLVMDDGEELDRFPIRQP